MRTLRDGLELAEAKKTRKKWDEVEAEARKGRKKWDEVEARRRGFFGSEDFKDQFEMKRRSFLDQDDLESKLHSIDEDCADDDGKLSKPRRFFDRKEASSRVSANPLPPEPSFQPGEDFGLIEYRKNQRRSMQQKATDLQNKFNYGVRMCFL